MEAVVNEYGVLWRRFPKLTDLFPVFRRSDLERELTEAKTRIGWQKKRVERIQHSLCRCRAQTMEQQLLQNELKVLFRFHFLSRTRNKS